MGELSYTPEELIELSKNPKSKIVSYEYDPEFLKLTRVFLDIPWDYSMSGVVGKKYQAIKDYLKWNKLSVKKYTPLIEKMGITWANNIKREN